MLDWLPQQLIAVNDSGKIADIVSVASDSEV